MKISELKKKIEEGGLSTYSAIYPDLEKAKARFLLAIDKFAAAYGEERDVFVLSVSGRSEISGNHTDHNHGKVIAAAINKDIIAIAAKRDDGIIRFRSEGYSEDVVKIDDTANPDNFENYTSASLIAGMAHGFAIKGYEIGGYDVYSTSDVLKGSGISSSAAYEVMIGNIFNHLYNDGRIENYEIAKLAQYAENVFFGKPCGLMDQMACAVGGFVYIDFEDARAPVVKSIDFPLCELGYSLCIVNTGGNHADLNEDYASVPREMKSVASLLGREVLRGLREEEILKNINNLRRNVGDRAVLRSLHFLRENDRVEKIKDALLKNDIDTFFTEVKKSGDSSFKYLQNVYTNANVKEQGISLALALADGYLQDKSGAFRVHGGGFAGTVQAFVKNGDVHGYVELMDSVFGDGATEVFTVRDRGAVRLF